MSIAFKYIPTQLFSNTAEYVFRSVFCRLGHWNNVKMGPPDVILGITEAYKKDKSSKKVNLGVGAYRDHKGRPWVLPSVKKAKKALHRANLNHEYAPIAGDAAFCKAAAKLAFGKKNCHLKEKLNCTIQTLSGTGALRLGLEFFANNFTKSKEIYLPDPTWGNHIPLCNRAGLCIKRYRYYDKATKGLNYTGALEDMCKMPKHSLILFHACAHNPTGVDPTRKEWKQISQTIKERQLMPIFDMAYQGFATGDVKNDAYAVRRFLKDGNLIVLCQSFAKNMGLYGERVGTLTIMCSSAEEAARLMSQLKIMVRVMYSNPPRFGARVATQILTNKKLRQQWLCDIKTMSGRVKKMRKELRKNIEKLGSKHQWKHITKQIGMFCYTGLSPQQVERLTKEYHIYMTKDGRIAVVGLTPKNVKYVAKAMHEVTSDKIKV